MTTVVLFHSVLGRRPAVDRFADELRGDGHEVVVADLFEGKTFDDYPPALAERDRLGIPTMLERAHAAVAEVTGPRIVVGTSLGTAPATVTAAASPDTRGLVLIQGILPLEMLGLERWPADVPIQLHLSPGDPWCEDDEVSEALPGYGDASIERHDYPGTDHLFDDEDLAVHEPAASSQLRDRIREFVARKG